LHYSGRAEVARAFGGDSINNKPITTVHRLLVAALCSGATLLIPRAAQAECPRADLDGDRVPDRIELSRRPGELAVLLSATHRWERLHAGDLIVKFVVTDVDRDGDPDLVVSTRRSGLQVWINKGRGFFFSTRSRQLKTRRLHFTHRVEHSVHGVRSVRWDDSVLNDPTRLFIVWSAPPRARLVAACQAPTAAQVAVTKFAGRRRTSRGPPLLLAL
jgi:hypothetical protein